MNRTTRLLVIFILSLSTIGASTCKPQISAPIVATAQAQDFPKVDPSQLLAQPPENHEAEPAQADVKPQGNSKPFEQSATMLNLLATLCLEDGKVNNECLDSSIECSLKIGPALPGALQKMRECAKKGLEGK